MKEWLPKMKENFREWVSHWRFTQMTDRSDETVIERTRQVRLISTDKAALTPQTRGFLIQIWGKGQRVDEVL